MVEVEKALPDDYEQLKIAANRTADWRERLNAVERLGAWKHPKITDLLIHRMTHDPVYPVQEAAYHKLREIGVDVDLPSRKTGDLIPKLTKTLIRVKKSLPNGHSFEEFKEKLKKMRIDIYDTYEGNKGTDFDSWLKEKWFSLRT